MRLSKFFIEHPVITIVLNTMIMVIGLLGAQTLTLREYPEISLPTLSVTVKYPNASAELIESSVTNVLEEQLAGIEGLEVMTSGTQQGKVWLNLNFYEGRDIEQALSLVREAISEARPKLPTSIQEPTIQKQTKSDGPNFMMIMVDSPSMTVGELTDYVNRYIKNSFRSLKGISEVEVWGQPYTMEISLDPKKMYAFGVNVNTVYKTLEENNLSFPAGKFQDQVPTTLAIQLSSVEEFEDLFVKSASGHPVALKSIATVELKTQNQLSRVRVNGQPGLAIAISHATDANPLEVAHLIHTHLQELKPTLPQGMALSVVIDQAEFIQASLNNIKSSVLEAVVLVLGVVFLFLGNLRATLIPLITIPISLVGTLLILKIFGFSINTLTLLAMVLAIGLVVDDAIVVLENMTRYIEQGLTPWAAAMKGSQEIGFAIIAMTLTLASVYIPIAFVQGMVGQLFVEFAVALAGSVLISGLVALTLSPMMGSKILSAHQPHPWSAFEAFLHQLTLDYSKCLVKSRNYTWLILGVMLIASGGSLLLCWKLPQEITPKEDRGLMGVYIPVIPGKDIEELDKRASEVEGIVQKIPEARRIVTFMGDWGASVCLPFKPSSERNRTPAQVAEAIKPMTGTMPSIDAWAWSWDTGIPGMSDVMRGAELSLAVLSTGTYTDLLKEMDKARKALEKLGIFESVYHDLKLNLAAYTVTINPHMLSKVGVSTSEIARTIEVFFSGSHSLRFQKDGYAYPITLKGQVKPWTLDELYVTNPQGKRVSLGAIAEIVPSAQPKSLEHYNQMRAAYLSASVSPDQNMASVMPVFLKEASKFLPDTFKKEWHGAARIYSKTSSTMILLFGLALVFIYAILTVQFENFLDPLIIMLTVPLACSGALIALKIGGQSLNVYSQIGLVTLIGLITKHGILIVEFANQKLKAGTDMLEAIEQSACLRLRPILMTTAAMIFGAIPLVLSKGAGFEARQAIGTVLLGGLSIGTLFTLLVLPRIYFVVKSKRYLLLLR